MLECVGLDLVDGPTRLSGAVFRYDVVSRLRKTCDTHDTAFLAFGFDDQRLRVVLEGEPHRVREAVRGFKVGTVRAAARWGLSVTSGHHDRRPCDSLEDAILWAHGPAPEQGPLATPWTSHRDLTGFRRARFYDASAVRRRLEPAALHRVLGGADERLAVVPRDPPPDVSIVGVLRAAAAVVGVVPSDRRCFRPFVHVARWCGFRTDDLARALALTQRRIRQLGAEPDPGVDLVRFTLVDPALSRVP